MKMGETLKIVLKVASVVLVVTLLGLCLFIVLQKDKSPSHLWKVIKHETETKSGEKVAEEVEPADCKVTTTKGVVVGQKTKMHHVDKYYYAFQGVPYAKPPVGDLRFMDPQPIETWKDDLEAKKEKGFCPQDTKYLFMNEGVKGSEDCLYLNVYTPQRPGKENHPKPVMVWIHGGGFMSGSGSSDIYGPDYLVENDVLLVTFNYRLGVFGFLNLGIEGAPGNVGLKDQVEVLKWVQKNIKDFGGDPDNVTLFGNNAGSVSIQLHQLSPLSTGLFHKAILQSGSILNPWAFERNPIKGAVRFANLTAECKVHTKPDAANKDEILSCLRQRPALDLVKLQDDMVDLVRMSAYQFYPFVPSVEMSTSTNKFLAKAPIEAAIAGHLVEVPTILGINKAEANILYFDDPDFLTPDIVNLLNFSREVLLPSILGVKKYEDRENIIKDIYKLLLQTNMISWKDFPKLRDVLSDCVINLGMFITSKAISKLSKPSYVYEFTFTGKLNYIGNIAKMNFDAMKKKFFKKDDPDKNKPKDSHAEEINKENLAVELNGASHTDELGYLFRVNRVNVDVVPESAENKIRTQMCKFWTNFAKYGSPSGKDTNAEWPENKPDSENIMEIGEEIKMTKNATFESDRFKFWWKIFTEFVLSKKLNL